MKRILVALLVGLFAPLYGQQQLCFSKNCPQTPATMFTLDQSDKQLNNIFRPLPALPAYEPIAPLALSPPTRQFFQYSAPTDADKGLGLASRSNATATIETSHSSATGTHSPHGLNGSHMAEPTSSTGRFSTGQEGIGFTPSSPKF
jgi:hypothetical protein